MQRDQILERANGVAFNFILAIFPAIIFLFTLIPYVSYFFPTLNREKILDFILELMPPTMAETAATTVSDIVSNTREGLLTLGFFFSLYLATNGMLSLIRAFNAMYKTVERRSEIKMRLIATGLTINLAIVLLIVITLLIVGQFVLNYVSNNLAEFGWTDIDRLTLYILFALRFLVILIGFFLAIATIYYFGPAVHWNWRFFSVGAFVATILCLAVTYGFSFYITNFGTYNKVYGSIGVLIALMIWIQLLTIVLLVGYEINASIHMAIRMQVMAHAKRQFKAKTKV